MNKFNKTILTIILSITLMLTTTIAVFAVDDHDPGGNCIIQLPYKVLDICENEII